jgi:Fur family ferric uptake transcriptional regulator
MYRRCATDDHHHHLVCRGCGHSVEISSPALESWAEAEARRHGFTSVTHTAEMYGLCSGCSAGPA